MFNIREVESPPNHVSSEIRSLCSEFGLHSYLGVLCGWQWAIENKDLRPIYQVELIRGNNKQTISAKKVETISKAMRIYRR